MAAVRSGGRSWSSPLRGSFVPLFFLLCPLSFAAAQEPAPLPSLTIPDGFGVNIHFTRADAAQLDLLAAGGNRFIRMDFVWSHIERERGQYRFDDYDALVESMTRRGIRILFILDYGNRHYDGGRAPHTDEARAAFARFAAAGARRYAGKGILWEIWNEPNLAQFWKPQPNARDYAGLALETISAIRTADPDAFIVAPASSGFPWDYFHELGQRGLWPRLNAVTVHPYRQQPPETAEADYGRLRLLLDHYAPARSLPILSGEWGYSTVWSGMDDDKQASYLVRQRLLNLSLSIPLSIWYDWHDDGEDPKEPEHHFGTVYRDFRPKPSYTAGKVLAETLAGYTFLRRLPTADARDHLLLLRKGEDIAIAAWTTGDPHTLRLDLPPGVIRIISRDGQSRAIRAATERVEILVTPSPQYLLLERSGAASELASWHPVQAMNVIRAGPDSLLKARIDNISPRLLKGEAVVYVDNQPVGKAAFDVHPGARSDLLVPILHPRIDRQIVPAEMRFEAEGGNLAHQSARILLLVSNHVRISILPPVAEAVTLHVDNPNAASLHGTLRIRAANMTASAPLDLQGNQRDKALTIHLPRPVGPGMAIHAEAADDAGRILLSSDPIRWTRTAPPEAPGQWQAIAEGDADVAASADLTIADPVPALLQPGLPSALKLDYRFANGWRYVMVRPPQHSRPIDGRPHMLGMWLYGDGSGNVLRCRFRDSTGQTFQPTFGPINWRGWRWITMPLDGRDASSWGGAGDGAIQYPIQWDSLLLIDNMNRQTDQPLSIQATGFALAH